MLTRLIFALTVTLVTTYQPALGECPLWTTLKNDTCKCETSLDEVLCEDGKGVQSVLQCFCMTTADKNRSLPLLGPCLYTCGVRRNTYIAIAMNRGEDLNNQTCGPFHRTGVLCSKCVEGYGLPVYSYSLSCVECKDYKYNWVKYVAVAYGPLTAFYMFAVTFRVSATSGLMVCYVAISQMLTIRRLVLWITNLRDYMQISSIIKLWVIFHSFWNLDFFRSIYTPFCLHPKLSAIHVLLLDYLIAVYPLMLVFITYAFVKLHDRYRIVVWLFKPLYFCFHKIKKEWDIKASLVGSFATFYLLSYVKAMNVTADVLTPTYLYSTEGEESKWYFYYDASIQYLGNDHLPYAVFAVVFSLLFNLLPLLLLCLYPCACFHKCLNKTTCRCHTLHIFMDAILGAFSHKPRERRYFGAIYLMVRIAHVLAFLVYTPYTYVIITCYIVLVFFTLIAIFRPHKKSLQNKTDLVLLLAVANIYLTCLFRQATTTSDPFYKYKFRYLVYVFTAILPMYGTIVMIKTLLPQQSIRPKLKNLHTRIRQKFNSRELKESLPYRIEHEEDALLNSPPRLP